MRFTINDLINKFLINRADLNQLEPLGVASDDVALDANILDDILRFLGLELEDLFVADERPPALALLARAQEGRESLRDLLALQDRMALGDLLRSVRRYHTLRHALDVPAPAGLPQLRGVLKPPSGLEPHEEGMVYAHQVRRYLAAHGGPDMEAPLPSMRALLDLLGVTVWAATHDDLSAEIEGASVSVGGPAILVNLIHGEHRWWHTRMTLAHELCHLLIDATFLDGTRRDAALIFSPDTTDHAHKPRRWPRPENDQFMWIEARANAFAAYLLAPPAAVAACLAEAPDAGALTRVEATMMRFGIGLTTATWHLFNLRCITKEQRHELLSPRMDDGARLLPSDHPDRFRAEEIGLERGPLYTLVCDALRKEKLSYAHATHLLGLKITDVIAPDLPPPVTREQLARRHATSTLRAALHIPDLYVERLEHHADHALAHVVIPTAPDAARRELHRLSADLDVALDVSAPSS